MNVDQFLKLFERVADAPDAPSALRQFILDLAVRGKIVPQDARDEPASELLKRIATEKRQLAKSGAIRLAPYLSDPKDDEYPFRIPNSWSWVRLGNILTKLTDGTHHSPANTLVGDFMYITAKNIKSDGVSLADVTYVSRKQHDEIYARCNPEKGDVLYIKDGATTGVVTINDIEAPFSMLSSVALLKLPSSVFNRLIAVFLRSPFFYWQMRGFMKGAAITRVTLSRMAPALLPLPPLAEQHRIVAKVDELMALCDQLEASRVESEARRERLTVAAFSRLNEADPEAAIFTNDIAFVIGSLKTLTMRPEQITHVRSAILNLAVRGKLVTQLSGERPVQSPALRKFAVASGMDNEVFEQWRNSIVLPKGWQLAPLSLVSEHIVDRPHSTPKWTERGEICVRTNQLRPRSLDLTNPRFVSPETYLERVERLEPRSNDILYSREGGILGIACRVPKGVRLCLGQRLMLIRSSSDMRPEFLEIVLNSPFITSIAKARTTGGAAPRVNMSTVRAYPIPLPPIAEQQRIVAKVDELIELCDRLEATLLDCDETRNRLLEALLAVALAQPHLETMYEERVIA